MAEPAAQPAAPRASVVRREVYAFLEVAALCGLAVAQPLLDITGKSPDFFLFYGAGAGEILALVVLVTVVPPVALWGIGALSGFAGPRVRVAVHAATVAALLAVLAVQVGKDLLPARGWPLALAAAAVAGLLTWVYVRWGGLAQLLRVAAVGPLAFALLFVFASPASAMVLGTGADGAGPGGRKAATHPPIVVLLLDEFPLVSLLGTDGKIDAKRYPNIARLAGGSTWYRNATAVSGWTPYAVPAMLSGKYPTTINQAPHYSAHPDNLFTLLAGAYDMKVQEGITQLCPPNECERTDPPDGGLPVLLRESATLLEQIVSPAASAVAPSEATYREMTLDEATKEAEEPPPSDPAFRFDTLAENQPARFTEFVNGLSRSTRPTLHFLHLLMPHTPWNYLASGTRYDAPEDLRYEDSGWESLGHERHLQQVAYTDKLIGATLNALEASGLFDDALLVVTADHGVSFTPGAAGRGLDKAQRGAAEILWVPLFIKEPKQTAGRVDDRNWEHVDLLPTVADLAGVTVPWQTDGVSAAAQTRTTADKPYHDTPTKPVTVPGPANLAAVLRGPALPSAPYPDLVGTAVAELPVSDGGARAAVGNKGAFGAVEPASGTLPALVYGTVPKSVRDGTPLAIAVNGRIGAVVRAAPVDSGGRRFAGLVTDESMFQAGANRVELFEVVDGGTGLRRLRI